VRLIAKSKGMRDAAWQERAVQRRAIAFVSYLLCCRMAALRKIRFEQAHCEPVFRGLLQLLEWLRPNALQMGSATAVKRLCILAALALPIRKTSYGALLLNDAMEWLSTWQLEIGTSADGVWQEGFAQHGSVLTTLSALSYDLRQAEVSSRAINGAMMKLARFADALLAERGACAQIDELPGAAYPQLQKTARAMQKSGPAINLVKQQQGSLRDTVLFADSGYFVSRSTRQGDKSCSHLVVHARPAAQGGPSLSFSLGGKPVLIGGGTIDARASREIRRISRLDPGSHNAVRIDGRTFAGLRNRDPAAVRIETAWEQPSWAAVRTLDNTFEAAEVARTIIHLKPAHGLIVVDELQAQGGEVRFEQFWHFSPSLQPSSCQGSTALFVAADGGFLNAAFDAGATAVLSQGTSGGIGWTSPRTRVVEANPYIVRERRATSTLMASFFQCNPTMRAFEVGVEGERGVWSVTVKSGAGAAIQFAFGDGSLRLVK
ncbi:MAG TPA: hypothetical protein VGG69_12015, partial [Rhizomicrobium sp.]